ncbi:hypothetical protein, partial [Klebsiella grimontii]
AFLSNFASIRQRHKISSLYNYQGANNHIAIRTEHGKNSNNKRQSSGVKNDSCVDYALAFVLSRGEHGLGVAKIRRSIAGR